MLKGIAGRTAIVTGAAGGIGSASCRRLHAEGANIVAVDIDEAGLASLAAELGDRFVAVFADVTDQAATEAFFATAVERFGSVERIKNSDANDLAEVPGISQALAEKILSSLQSN